LIPLLLVSSLALVGCGDEGSPTAANTSTQTPVDSPSATDKPTDSQTKATPDWPACGSVWKGGATLKRSYKGCLDDGEPVKADRILCSFGTPIVTYAHRYYAQPGHQIHDVGSLKKSSEFQHDLDICTG
jgi:hypothetical protein